MSPRPLLLLFWSAVALTASLGGMAGCSALETPTSDAESGGPGTRALDGDDPTCSTDKDCATGEQCLDGLCQMQRCGTQAYSSVPPLGKHSYFAVDRELLVISDDAAKVDGYEPTDGSFAHPQALAFTIEGRRILDTTGGDLTGRRPESTASIVEGSTSLFLRTGTVRSDLELGFLPVATAAGDLEGDGVDEVVVLGGNGELAICSVPKKSCERRNFSGFVGKDVTVADVDGDGKAEPILLGDLKDGNSVIVVFNVDAKASGQPELVQIAAGRTLTRIAAGDLDGQAPSEIVALEDAGYLDLRADTLHFYGQKDGKLTETGTHAIASDAIDVHIGDVEGDQKVEILVLESSGLEVFVPSSASDATSSYKTTLTASTKPSRLAMVDLDGDSPAGSLEGESLLVPGPVVPISVMVYPPYSRTRSDGTSQIGLGSRETTTAIEASTVTLKASVALGFEAEFPGVAKVSVIGKVEAQVAHTLANARSVSVGDRFTVDAKPELEGPDNGVAVLACACYHAYTYRVEDPAGRLGAKGGDGKLMSVFVPVGGQTSLWSLKRYNVLARRLGSVPVIEVPYLVGDPTSYPTAMTKLNGEPIPAADMLFSAPRAYRTSDVARVGWQLDIAESTSNTEARSIGVSVRGQLKAGPVIVEGEVGAVMGEAYTVTVGRETSFSGSVPPVRNSASTPEDENELYGYGFSPLVYRDRYAVKGGDPGGYFVVTYTVAP